MDTNRSYMTCTISSKVEGRADWTHSSAMNFGDRLASIRSISGYRGPRQSGHPIHDVTHVVRAFSPSTVDVELESYWPPAPVINSVTSRVLTCCNVDVGSVPAPSTTQIDAIMAQLRGEIPTTTLLPNFLLELPEALNLHTQLRQAFQPGVKNWSNAGLAYSFGLKPLIRDLNDLLNTTRRVKKRLRKLASISDSSFQKYTFGVALEKPHDIVVTDSGAYGPITQGFLRGVSSDAQASVDMNIFARVLRTRRVDSNIDTFSAYADDLGFSKLGSVIWEGIPFSFVADWFYPCGRALNGLNTAAFEGCLYATSIGHQSHTTITGDVYCTGVYQAPVGAWYQTDGKNIKGGQKLKIGSAYAKFYNRASGLPATHEVSHYGMRQSILSAMLCFQRL